MVQLQEVRQVGVPIDQAFAYTADFSNIGLWDPGVAASQKIGDSALGVGTQFDLQVRFGSRETPMTYTITEFEPNDRVVLEGKGNQLVAIDTISFRAIPGGTEINYTADLAFRGFMRLLAPFLTRTMDKIGRKALDGLTARLGPLQ